MERKSKILLVLDLDETLIHSSEKILNSKYSFHFQYEYYYVYLRPGLSQFLLQMNDYFDLAVWSSGGDDYVNEVVNNIKPSDINFQFVWGRSRCTTKRNYETDEFYQVKRLKKVKSQGYDIQDILMVDDSPEKTKDNFGNAVYIEPFYGDENDIELKNLAEYLITIKDVENVRTIEKRGWKNSFE